MTTAPLAAFLRALLDAKVAGFYVPEIEDVYFRYDSFREPHALALDFGH